MPFSRTVTNPPSSIPVTLEDEVDLEALTLTPLPEEVLTLYTLLKSVVLRFSLNTKPFFPFANKTPSKIFPSETYFPELLILVITCPFCIVVTTFPDVLGSLYKETLSLFITAISLQFVSIVTELSEYVFPEYVL